jgi:5-methylcytosine-specific restriction endonuclease McrA
MKNRLYNKGRWTEARYKAFKISALRAYMKRWEPLWDIKTKAKVGRMVNKRTGRLAEHYACAGCGGFFVSSDVQVDHIKPVVDPKDGFQDLDTFSDRLYCEEENLQVLCKECHKVKTNLERKERKKK